MNMSRKSLSVLVAISILMMNCNAGAKVLTDKVKKPLNIILMIGDGMGLSQISAASFLFGGLTLDQLIDIGLIKTSSGDDYITDSAAGATAYSTGEKTYNGAIGVDMNKMPLKNIIELIEQKGLSSGLISTCSITHATPASFFAHQPDREMHQAIANDFYGKGIDFVAGTGKPYFDMARLVIDGYTIHNGPDFGSERTTGKQFWFYNDSIHPPKADERGPWLSAATKKGIECLSTNKNGFFLMVEGSQIDWGGHDNDFNYVMSELYDFDKAVCAAIEFARKDGNTLVIVTADHETGGLSLDKGTFEPKGIEHHFSSTHHSGVMVPLYAFGPGAEQFRGTHENTEVYVRMKTLFGL